MSAAPGPGAGGAPGPAPGGAGGAPGPGPGGAGGAPGPGTGGAGGAPGPGASGAGGASGPGAGGAGAGGPPPQPQPVVFALSPARASNVLLNYTTPGDIKQYYKSAAGLEPKFDLSSSGMLGFVCAFQDRARIANWQMTLSFQVQGVLFNLIAQYGSVTIKQVMVYVLTYHGTPSRHAQNTDQIYICLAASLTNEAKHKVALDAHKYTVGNDCDGLLYFKVIVGLAHVDT
jgi:hypothetical protein